MALLSVTREESFRPPPLEIELRLTPEEALLLSALFGRLSRNKVSNAIEEDTRRVDDIYQLTASIYSKLFSEGIGEDV